MKKLLISAALLLSIISCKKEPVKSYNITLIVQGKGTYNYQIGATKQSGHVNTSQTFTGVAHAGDLVELDAICDIPTNGISVELDSDPIVGGSNYNCVGGGKQQVQFQFQ